MIQDELKYRILQALGLTPTTEQEHAIDVFTQFMTDRSEQVVMILRGSAGTGKTTLAGAIVKALAALKQKLILLAPTGRAAKVFSLYAGHPAYTIHRRIYRQKTAGDLSSFNLNNNLNRDTLFIIDEASMISNDLLGNHNSQFSTLNSQFGSGCLLDDLMEFVYQGQNCRMLLIGDKAQLPPVGEEESPALMADVLRGYGMTVYECDLNQVLRQSEASGILWNATRIREMFSRSEECGVWSEDTPEADSSLQGNLTPHSTLLTPRIKLTSFPDISVVPGDELIESLASSYSRVGMDETMVITRSNKRANIYNQGIRNTVLDREDELCRGDLLMIVKNNYFWGSVECGVRSEDTSAAGSILQGNLTPHSTLHTPRLSFIANGDRAVVQRVRNIHELYGFRFAEVTMTFPDYDDYELTATVLLDTLTSEAPALTREQQEQLYNAVLEDYADIPIKADRIAKLKTDRYYNALQVKFAYAVTCHKAQGGQWAHIYLDQGYMTDDMLTPDYIHWLYTAFTRATEKLFLVNWPKTQISVD
jgi:tRNA A37 threonylcarbamoyladenosine biosynthesis protein TsaE